MSIKSFLNYILPHLLAILVMVIVATTYFYPQLQGKSLAGEDVVSGTQAGGETEEYKKITGKDFYLWSNAQFGGMPKMMWVPMKHNKVNAFFSALKLGIGGPIGVFLAIMIAGYLLFISIGANKIIAVGASLGMSLATSNVTLWQAGHFSKITTLALVPLILLGIYYVFEKRKLLLGFVIYTVALSISLFQQHPQMIYYLFMCLGFVGLAYVIVSIKKGWDRQLLQGVGLLVIGTLLALSVNMTRMISVYDYKQQSLRGDAILTENVDSETADSGLGFDYAMQWSSDWKDIMATYLIPGFVGGGSGERVSKKSETFKAFRMERAPLYWGQLPFTVGPMYIGVVSFFLFVLALLILEGPIKWGIASAVGFMTLCAMGSHVEFLNRFLFDHLPLYNSFRAPQSILSVLLFLIPFLSVLVLVQIEKSKNRKLKKKSKVELLQNLTKKLFIASAVILIPILLFALLGPSMLDFIAPGDARYTAQNVDVSVFVNDRSSLLRRDAFRSFFLVLFAGAGIYLYIQDKIKSYVLYLLLGAMMVIDIWGVSTRYISHDDFKTKSNAAQDDFAPRPVDNQIKALEPDRARYRVQDLTIDTYNNSKTSYFHNTIGGYDAAKLRRFQDVYLRYLSRNSQVVYDMLNTKYFILNGDEGITIQRNEGALGNAWFVKRIKEVTSSDQEFASLENLIPRDEAAVLKSEFGKQLSNWTLNYDPTATISLVSYEPDRLVYKTSASTDQLAVFSEVWYNGNRDWVSYIDGKRVDHLRANYLLRAMRVPAGQHEIVFEFKPIVYALGENVSMVSWWLLVLLILGTIYYYGKPFIDSFNSSDDKVVI